MNITKESPFTILNLIDSFKFYTGSVAIHRIFVFHFCILFNLVNPTEIVNLFFFQERQGPEGSSHVFGQT